MPKKVNWFRSTIPIKENETIEDALEMACDVNPEEEMRAMLESSSEDGSEDESEDESDK